MNSGNCAEFPVAPRCALAHDPGHDSGKIEGRAGQAREGRDCRCAAGLSPRARADQARRLAGGRLRRGRARSAGGPGGRRRRGARSQADPQGHRRFQAADAGAARAIVRGNLRDLIVRGRLRIAFADRPRQYPARLAVGAQARGAGAAGNAQTRVRRRPRPARHRLRLRGGDRRRRPGGLDSGSIDHRQGDARSPDVRAGAGLSRLWF